MRQEKTEKERQEDTEKERQEWRLVKEIVTELADTARWRGQLQASRQMVIKGLDQDAGLGSVGLRTWTQISGIRIHLLSKETSSSPRLLQLEE
ncbi:hypothetical protein RRG08_032576 [Elysia crispata]|uniref:Uncharacterized protein n=1 Tax=Elysia crispata TaxID=231223 RepID=A0AAE0ZXE5_9GAST|nr:hypothetical protein RRG08_032576 [Elysia crispata]